MYQFDNFNAQLNRIKARESTEYGISFGLSFEFDNNNSKKKTIRIHNVQNCK